MEETYNRGVGQYLFFDDEADETINYFADLYYANTDRSTSELSEVWLEVAPDMAASFVSIDQVCDPCPIGGTDCAQCSFSFNINWFALRAKLNL